MHGSWGNQISASEAFERMGADVMRWQFCQQPPSQDLLFGFKPGYEIQRKVLTLWNSVAFFTQYADIAGFTPSYADLEAAADDADRHPMDRWATALTDRFVATATEGYESYLTVNVLRAYEQYVDDLSNWYIRRSRRRFWNGDEAALRTLWVSLVQSLRAVSPVLPFLTEHLWQRLVGARLPGRPAVGVPRRLAGRRAGRRRAARRRGGDAQGHRARPPRPLRRQAPAAPAARQARRRRAGAPRRPRRGDRRGAARQGGAVRADRGDRGQGPAQPQDARAAPRRRP